MKIVIVGAGIAGVATAWRLAQAGCEVDVIERGVAGRGATWASAGMLAPHAELGAENNALARFAKASRAAWPAFAHEIEAESGQSIGFRESGSLIVADDDTRAKELKRSASEGGGQWLSPKELAAREPLLSPELDGALYVPGDAQVDNRALVPALAAALARRNIPIREYCGARDLFVTDGRIRGITTSDGLIQADAVVLASGAWLNRIGGEATPKIAPVKGQMLALEPPAGTRLPDALIWSEDVYLVARRGRLLVGATVEDAGFDTSVTRKSRDTLLSGVTRVIPAARDWRVAEMWAGLRPRSADDAPVLGATAIAGLYVAGGQFRNGILFAPALGDAMRDIVLGNSIDADIASFSPHRFRRS